MTLCWHCKSPFMPHSLTGHCLYCGYSPDQDLENAIQKRKDASGDEYYQDPRVGIPRFSWDKGKLARITLEDLQELSTRQICDKYEISYSWGSHRIPKLRKKYNCEWAKRIK